MDPPLVKLLQGHDQSNHLRRETRRSLFRHNSGGYREVFGRFRAVLSPKAVPQIFRSDSFHRRDRFRQIFVQIGAILAIFRSFEVFGTVFFLKTLNGRLPLEDGSDRRETLGKRVSDDSQHFIFYAEKNILGKKIDKKSDITSRTSRFGGAINFSALLARQPRKTTLGEPNFNSV